MPVHVVMEQPSARHLVGLRRGVATLLGVSFILVSWATLPVAAYLAYPWFHDRYSRHDWSSFEKGTVVTYLVLVVALLVVPWFVGLRLVRGSRRLVLFLRRFGYTDATDVLTFAALTTMGRSWRLVTLDDAAVAPVGISRGMVKFAAVDEVSRIWVGRARKRIGLVARVALGAGLVGMAVVAGHTRHRHHSELKMVKASVAPPGTHVDDAGTFRIFLIVAGVAVIAVIALAVVALILRPVFRPVHRFSATLRRAEQAKVTRVVSQQDVLKVAGAVRDQARRVFSPRLMVLSVDSAVWQKTVKTVANLASVVLIDVSVLTENLLWEVAEVVEDPSTACVLVGHAEGLRALDVIDTPLERRLVELLDGRTILAYETTEQGMTRFANALRATLEAAVSRRR